MTWHNYWPINDAKSGIGHLATTTGLSRVRLYRMVSKGVRGILELVSCFQVLGLLTGGPCHSNSLATFCQRAGHNITASRSLMTLSNIDRYDVLTYQNRLKVGDYHITKHSVVSAFIVKLSWRCHIQIGSIHPICNGAI